MSAMVVLGQMIVLLAMMAVGYIAYKKQILNDETSARISRLVVHVFNPLLIVNSVLSYEGATAEKIVENLLMVGAYFVLLFLGGCVAVLVFRPRGGQGALYLLMMLFSNVGFMGIPVIQGVYGKAATAYVAFYVLVYNALLYTLGNYLAERAGAKYQGLEQKSKGSALGALKGMANPGVFGSIVAILILVTGVSLPSLIGTFCGYMGNVTIPLSMLLIGVSAAQMGAKVFVGDAKLYLFLAFKMVVYPIVIVLIFRRFPVDSLVFGVFALEMGMPVGSIVTLMAQDKGADSMYCSRGIILSTLASIVTIPIVGLFL